MDFQVVTISVSNLSVSKQFYEEVLGFVPDVYYEKWQSYKLETTGGFGIIEERNLTRTPSKDIINFQVSNVESLWSRIRDRVKIESELQVMPWGTYKFVILDPDGFRLGFVGE